MVIFKLLKQLNNDALLSAIFYAANCKIETTQDETVIGYVMPENKGFKIVLNPEKMLNSEMTFFVLAHEILHVYFSHFNFIRPNHSLDNISKDFAINHFLKDYLNKSNSDLSKYRAIFNEYIAQNFGLDIDEKSDSMTVYDLLEKNAPNIPKLDSFCSTDAAKNKMTQNEIDLFSEKLGEKIKENADLEKLIDLENKMQNDKKNKIGNKSGGIARKILESREGKSSKEIAKILLSRVISNNAHRFTNKKSSRRDDSIDARIKQKNNKVCFVVDTSGSITDKNLELINQVIESSSKLASITIRCGDTRLQNEITLKQNQKLSRDFFIGGGGTDLNFAKQDNDNFLHYLIFTDGLIPEMKEKFNRTFFIFDNYAFLENEKCYKLRG
jgi:predicted metal-dependent peptidase